MVGGGWVEGGMKDRVEVGEDGNLQPGFSFFSLLPSSRLARTGAPSSLSVSEPHLNASSSSLGPPSTLAPPLLSARYVLVSVATDDIIESRAESEASLVEGEGDGGRGVCLCMCE